MERESDLDPARFRYLIEHVQDAIVEFELVDGEPIIRNVNAAFADVFGHDRSAVEARSLNELIVPPWERETAASFDKQVAEDTVSYHRVHRETADGLREFLYRAIPSETDGERIRAFAIYTDLTEVRRYERQFQVFARLLRHNLRTELTVIDGHLEALRERAAELDPEVAERLDSIADAEENLAALVDEAKSIQNALEASPPAHPEIDCVPLVERVVESFRETSSHAEIRTELPASLPVAATAHLETALTALVENAIVHNPDATPFVLLTTRVNRDDGWTEIVVADDGPEIPEMERRVVTGETDIGQINHGSGLGLWLTKWIVERFGGVIRFETTPEGGNRVHLRLQLTRREE